MSNQSCVIPISRLDASKLGRERREREEREREREREECVEAGSLRCSLGRSGKVSSGDRHLTDVPLNMAVNVVIPQSDILYFGT